LISDPLRNDESGASDDGSALDRDAKIEKLLLVGLDHYFSARYELAINVWTRALFLDRNHARARAYIERARSALAEQQRESEELLHSGVAAFNRGESGEARRLLHAAIDRGAPSDEALAVLERLNRLDAAVAAHAAAPAESRQQRAAVSGAAAISAPAGSRAVVGLAIGVLAVVGWATWTNRIDWRSFLALAQSAARGDAPVARNAAPVTRDAPLPLPRRGEDALARAIAGLDRAPSRRAVGSRDGASDRQPAGGCRPPSRRHSAPAPRVDDAAGGHRGRPRQNRAAESMKCPKCGYLGFEDVERCRNCGYEFSLDALPITDLTIRRDTRPLTPLDVLSLIDSNAPGTGRRMTETSAADLDRVFGGPDGAPSPAGLSPDAVTSVPEVPRSRQVGSLPAAVIAAATELPLFGPPIPDDEPLITRASPPRQPLAVRRATLEVPRVRGDAPRTPSFALGLDDASSPTTGASAAARRAVASWGDVSETIADAAVAARFVAVVIDLVILAAIDAVVIYFTMQICGLTLADVDVLPKGPLIAFLLVQNGGYLVAFTAGGQTLGKMAAGIRVVPASTDAPLDLGRAFLRTLMWVLLAVPAGLGFLSAIASRDRRGWHDRFAGTRVVRASL